MTLIADILLIIYVGHVFLYIGSALVERQKLLHTFVLSVPLFSFILFSIFDACLYLFIWHIVMYALTNLCISRLIMISVISMRHSNFSLNNYFNVFIPLVYLFIFSLMC